MKTKQPTLFSELVSYLNKNLNKELDLNLFAEQMVEKGLMLRQTNGVIYNVTLMDYKSKLKNQGYLECKRRSQIVKPIKIIPKTKKVSDLL